MINSLAIRRRNRTLIGEEEEIDNEEADGPPPKRSRTGRLSLDAEEAAFAGSLSPLRSRSRRNTMESQDVNLDGYNDEDRGGDGDGDQTRVRDSDADPVDEDESNEARNGEDEQEMGFLDNGV